MHELLPRLFLGLLYFIFGLNGFLHFRPLPEMNESMKKFNQALQDTEIILPVVKVFEVVFGLALILNVFAAVATLALLPISFFIIVAHLRFNRPKGFVMAGVIGLCTAILLKYHWVAYGMLLQP